MLLNSLCCIVVTCLGLNSHGLHDFEYYLCHLLMVLSKKLNICTKWDEPFFRIRYMVRRVPNVSWCYHPWHRMAWVQSHCENMIHTFEKILFVSLFIHSVSPKILCHAFCIYRILWHSIDKTQTPATAFVVAYWAEIIVWKDAGSNVFDRKTNRKKQTNSKFREEKYLKREDDHWKKRDKTFFFL